MACTCSDTNNGKLSYFLNLRNKILRSPSDIESYFVNESQGLLADNSEILSNLIKSCEVMGVDGVEFVSSFYYLDLFENISASDFEQFLHAMGLSFPEFMNGRDYKCVYSEKLGCHYCKVTRGHYCHFRCSSDCPR